MGIPKSWWAGGNSPTYHDRLGRRGLIPISPCSCCFDMLIVRKHSFPRLFLSVYIFKDCVIWKVKYQNFQEHLVGWEHLRKSLELWLFKSKFTKQRKIKIQFPCCTSHVRYLTATSNYRRSYSIVADRSVGQSCSRCSSRDILPQNTKVIFLQNVPGISILF